MNEPITRVAAFTGDQAVEMAISERLECTADYIEDKNLIHPDGGKPRDDWPCAIFRPEANMYRFRLSCDTAGLLCDERACRLYDLPDGTKHAIFMILTGEESEIHDFCQALCDLSGMTCHIMVEEDEADTCLWEKTLTTTRTPKTPDDFVALMFEAYEW